MITSLIVAVSENNVIGKDNNLIWRLSADLKRFKSLTTGHHIIMGRKTFESIGKALPNRTSVIITRQKNYKVENCICVNSLEEAIEVCKDENEAFIIGGGEIYNQAIDLVDKMYITLVHNTYKGDTFFPSVESDKWLLLSEENHKADAKNEIDYSFLNYQRK